MLLLLPDFPVNYKNLQNMVDKIDWINAEIFNLAKSNQEFSKIVNWKIQRLEWKKNRIIFKEIFYKKKFSKKQLQFFELCKKIDRTLLILWENLKYRNLCSSTVISKLKNAREKYRTCRIPLLKRSREFLSKIEIKSGCISCVKEFGLGQPIWWDQSSIVIELLLFWDKKKTIKNFIKREYLINIDKKIKKKSKKILLGSIAKIFHDIKNHKGLNYKTPSCTFIITKKKIFCNLKFNWNHMRFF
jgi:hypothetical protein